MPYFRGPGRRIRHALGRPLPRLIHRIRGSDEGQGSIFIIAVVALAFVLTAYFVDISRSLHAHGASLETAAQAARAAADQVTQESLRSGDPTQLRIDPAAARTAGQQWLSRAGASGEVRVNAEATLVTVTARIPCQAGLLSALGYGDLSREASASATLLYGSADGGPGQPIALEGGSQAVLASLEIGSDAPGAAT